MFAGIVQGVVEIENEDFLQGKTLSCHSDASRNLVTLNTLDSVSRHGMTAEITSP